MKNFLSKLISDSKVQTALWQIANTLVVLAITYLAGLELTNPITIGLTAVALALLNFTTKYINTNYLK